MNISLTMIGYISNKSPVIDLLAAKINLRSFDLSMTTNVTSEDIHDHKKINIL